MSLLNVSRVITILGLGLLAGIFLGTSASAPARSAMNLAGFVEHQQVVHIYYVRMMPALMLITFIAFVVSLWLMRSQIRGTQFVLTALSLAGLIFIFVLTRFVNVPINDQLMTWSASNPPANLRELWAPWETANHIRTIVSVIVFAFSVIALTVSSRPAHSRK